MAMTVGQAHDFQWELVVEKHVKFDGLYLKKLFSRGLLMDQSLEYSKSFAITIFELTSSGSFFLI